MAQDVSPSSYLFSRRMALSPARNAEAHTVFCALLPANAALVANEGSRQDSGHE